MRSRSVRSRTVLVSGSCRFGARRRVLLRRSAGVLVREGELAVVGAAGGRELFEGEVLVVALEHPPARASQQAHRGPRPGGLCSGATSARSCPGWSSWISSRVRSRARESAV